MSSIDLCVCQCLRRRAGDKRLDREPHQQMSLLLSRLSEAERLRYAAVEADWPRHGGAHPGAQLTGLDEKPIRRGQEEVAGSLAGVPIKRQRRPRGRAAAGRKKTRPS